MHKTQTDNNYKSFEFEVLHYLQFCEHSKHFALLSVKLKYLKYPN
jgi:hypothetical protein